MKFGILTGGGDSPGMNAFVRAVVRTALNTEPQTSVWGVYDGWKGLAENNYRKLNKLSVAGLSSTGGTVLGTMRFPELAHNSEIQERIATDLHNHGFDYIFICGGNGSLKASAVIESILRERNRRTRIMFAPGSIDNDVCNVYGSSLGFYSAIDKSLEMLEWIRDTASSHRRVYLIRSMGRQSSYLAAFAGIVTGAEHVIRPNEEVDYEEMTEMIAGRNRDTRIIISEAFPQSLNEVKLELELRFRARGIKSEIRTVDMSYFQRGGKAAVTDILRASWLGYRMVRDAFEEVSSGFYTAFYTGHSPKPLPLDFAANADVTNHDDIPEYLLDFMSALR